MEVRWLGHSTVLLELDGARVLTDPLLRRRVAHLRRSSPAPTETAVDAVLISHGHHDHLDLPSLRKLPRSVPVVVPRGLGPLVRKQGFADVREVLAGDELEVSGLRVRVSHAEHDERRVGSRARAAPVGYALLGSSRVFFAGDTDVYPGLEGIVSELDLALVPIWGWGASLGTGHLDPAQRRRRGGAAETASRRADPLGHVSAAPPAVARPVSPRPGRRVRGRRARARTRGRGPRAGTGRIPHNAAMNHPL